MGSVAIPADQRENRISRRGDCPPKLGNMEKLPQPPAHLQDDPGAHGTDVMGQMHQVSLLPGGQGHSAAHVLSCVGTVPLHPSARHR